MALSKIGLLAVKGTRGIVKEIAANQRVTRQAVYQWIELNHENLTRDSVLEIIIRRSGFAKEQILEGVLIEEGQK